MGEHDECNQLWEQVKAVRELLELGCSRVKVGNIEVERTRVTPEVFVDEEPRSPVDIWRDMQVDTRDALWDHVGGPPPRESGEAS